ncbi:MAG: hypothetical protein O9277_00625 [Magnetospirillum sp.]|nr:hypothetical protein [Magnetospirillum sp.]
MIAAVRQAILSILGALLLPFALPSLIRAVIRALRRHKDDSAILFSTSGFGYTVVAPDLMRRTFKGRAGVVFFGPVWRYNPIVEELYSDTTVTICTVPAWVAIGQYRVSLPSRILFLKIAIPLLSAYWRAQGKICVVFSDSPDFHRLLPEAELSDLGHARLGHALPHLRYHWVPRYFRLGLAADKPRARLSEATRARCSTKIDCVTEPGRGDVCLYARYRESTSSCSVTNRNGAAAADYVPAIEWLAARGYRVLITGDVDFSEALNGTARARSILPGDVDVPRGEFLLYAATECDLWIGEDGGGTNVGWVARRKMLGVNWFPFYAVFPGITLCYKTVHSPGAAKPLGPDFMFGPGAFEFGFPGLELRGNSPELLRAAVIDFVERHERGDPPGLPVSALGTVSPDVWFNFVPAYISPPWLSAVLTVPGLSGNQHRRPVSATD